MARKICQILNNMSLNFAIALCNSVYRPVMHRCNLCFVASTFSCGYLLLTSGFSIYTLRQYSYKEFSKFLPRFGFASVGFASIGIRSFCVVIYKLFIKTYTIDPLLIESDEQENEGRVNFLDELLGSVSWVCLVSSLYYHHGYYVTGTIVVTGLSAINILRLIRDFSKENENENRERSGIVSYAKSLPKETAGILTTLWIFSSGFFAWRVNNGYGLLANFPHIVSSLGAPVEGFYQGWTIGRAVNNYMMMAYIILMTEALKKAPD